MMSRFGNFLTISAVALSLSFGVALAGPNEAVEARQTQMKVFGKSVGALAGILKGETPYDAALVKTTTDVMGAAYQAAFAAGGWAPESQTATIPHRMKPEFWTDTAGAAAEGKAFSDALAAVAASTDEAGFKAAFPALGASCASCHEKFRAPKQ